MYRMPRAEIVLLDEVNKPTFIMNLNSDDMIVLVKDKFISWKELVRHWTSMELNFII
jgi:hypothetical protein